MKRRFAFTSLVTFLCLLAAGVPAATQVRPAAIPSQRIPMAAPPPPAPAPDVSPIRTLARFFGLTAEQAEQLRGFLDQQRQRIEPLRLQIAEKENALREALASNPDPATVGRLVIEIHALQGRINEAHMQLIPGFESILDDEQLRKLQMVRQAARLQPVVDVMRQLNLLPGPPR
jgi:Spy/CpxP family protein refolding chaperone